MLIACIAIGIYYKLKIPTLRFEAIASHYETVKETVKKATEERQVKKEFILEKQEKNTPPSPTQLQENTEKTLLKSILKDKLANKIQQKEDEQTIRQLHINFPKNKPTFSIDLLEKNHHT